MRLINETFNKNELTHKQLCGYAEALSDFVVEVIKDAKDIDEGRMSAPRLITFLAGNFNRRMEKLNMETRIEE
jgi:hypothetical protein